MIEIVPMMLFILGWHPDRPGEIDLQRPAVVFTSEGDCESAGSAMAQHMTEAASDRSGVRYEHRCFAFPSRDELQTALEKRSAPRP